MSTQEETGMAGAVDRGNAGATKTPSVTYSCQCGVRWAGISRCHCAGCHRAFAGVTGFDAHRRDVKGVGTCFDPGIAKREQVLIDGVWRNPASRPEHWL